MRVAIIPARIGSQRIPKKNVKDFLGIPIIGRVILNLKSSEFFDRIIVSTDSDEIAVVAKNFGAEVPFMRPSNLSDNLTDTKSVIQHAILTLDLMGSDIHYCCVYPTSVLLTKDVLIDSYSIYATGEWDHVLAAYKIEPSPLRSFRVHDEDGGIVMLHPEYWSYRSQDLPPVYCDAGLLYWGDEQSWLDNSPLFNQNSTFIEVSSNEVVDINESNDWKKAESIYTEMRMSGKHV
jgi:pseudaminic acid cytidylyltransferase